MVAHCDHTCPDRPVYHYGRLQTQSSIRILRLLPGEGSSPLACVLFDVTLDTHSDYDAISYAWEDSELSESIFADGCVIYITKSSKKALQQLRSPDSSRDLWIDAVCINQDDIEECGVQVQLMRQIYKTARCVVIYIGDATPESDHAMRFLKEMAGPRQQWFRYGPSGYEVQSSDTSSELSTGNPLEAPGPEWVIVYRNSSDRYKYFSDVYNEDWRALNSLLARSWWSRTWVVQEIWSASNALLQCGSTTLTWEAFTRALDYDEEEDEMGGLIMGTAREDEWSALRQRYGLAIHISKKRLDGTLSSLLWNTWDREATDPRDKVFAVLNLVGDSHKCSLSPDYSLSMSDVYIAATWDIIQHQQSLDILLAANGLDRSSGLPSWVPDWRSAANARRPALFVNRGRFATKYWPKSFQETKVHRGYYACGKLKLVCAFDDASMTLRVSSIPVDLVSEVDEVHAEEFTEEDALEKASTFFGKVSGTATLSVSQLEELEHVLCAGPYESTTKWAMENILRKRRFFITQRRRLAIGPAQMAQGDVIRLISGCNFPIVLRAEDEHYALVGEAYVAGIMKGETLRQHDDFGRTPAWKNITLQ